MIPITPTTNRLALASVISAVLTLSAFCGGVVPIPLTGWVCYPAAILLGVAALLTGFGALRQVRTSGERGRMLALLGIWTGAITILAVVCFTTVTIILVYYGAETITTIWSRFSP
jgi:hypothetical protein